VQTRGHIAGAARLPAQKGENLFIFHERDLPRSAGDEKDVRLWAISESARGQQPKAARIGDQIKIFPDEMQGQFLEPRQHVVRPGEIELGQARIEQHHNLHGLTSIGRAARILFQPEGWVRT
jgi:hypothetical protein